MLAPQSVLATTQVFYSHFSMKAKPNPWSKYDSTVGCLILGLNPPKVLSQNLHEDRYPYSARELLAVIRHLERFPNEPLEEVGYWGSARRLY